MIDWEKDCLPQVGQWNMMNKVVSLVRYILIAMAYEYNNPVPFIYFHLSMYARAYCDCVHL